MHANVVFYYQNQDMDNVNGIAQVLHLMPTRCIWGWCCASCTVYTLERFSSREALHYQCIMLALIYRLLTVCSSNEILTTKLLRWAYLVAGFQQNGDTSIPPTLGNCSAADLLQV